MIAPKTAHRRAFSLIESAIYLGIIGLIISGIWAGVASYTFNRKVSEIAGEVIRVGMNARSLWPRQLVTADYNSGSATTAGIRAGLFNASWPILSGYPQHPFGGNFSIQVWGSGSFVAIGISSLEHDECTALYARLAISIKSGDIIQILSTNGGITPTSSVSNIVYTADIVCATTNTYITVYFKL